jgi:hypothetical protein
MRAMSLGPLLRMPSSRPGPRWAWALLLALLLPLAQGAAAGHAITHHGTPAPLRDAAPSALDATCVQCLLAAPVGAGALPSTPPAFDVPGAAHATPPAPAFSEPASALALAYRSRAPPSSLH